MEGKRIMSELNKKALELYQLHQKYGVICENCRNYKATEYICDDDGNPVMSTGTCSHRCGASAVSTNFCLAFK